MNSRLNPISHNTLKRESIMGNKVEIEYKPKIWCEPEHEEEVEKLFALLDEALEEEQAEKEKEEKKKAEEEEAAWKELLDFVEALLKANVITGEVVQVELYELVSDDEN